MHRLRLLHIHPNPLYYITEAEEPAQRHDSTTAKGTTRTAYSSRAHFTHTASGVTIGVVKPSSKRWQRLHLHPAQYTQLSSTPGKVDITMSNDPTALLALPQ
jgi:hypothetical protein